MAFDAHSNFAHSTVLVAPVPALTGLSLIVAAGEGARFPTAPFNCSVWPSSTPSPLYTNAEIIRVTAVVGDVLTIVRAQEGTAAIAIAAGYFIANTASNKVFTDIEGAMIQGISAGAAVATASQVVFSNANGVSFGVAGQTVTASVAAGGAGSLNISAGTTSQNLTAVTFSNSNGLAFGLDAALSQITGSYTVPTQSTQPVAASASNGSFLFSTIAFSNANGVTFGTSAGSIISASVAVGGAAGSISAGTTSVALGQAVFSNSNNVTFGLAGSTVTASVTVASTQGSINVSAGTTSNNLSALTFSNANGVTFGINASTITASVAAVAGAQTGISGLQVSDTTYSSGTVTFQNANGISFGSSGANGISASYTVPVVTNSSMTVSDALTSGTLARLAFTNLNGVTLSLSTGAGGSHTIVGSHNGLTSQSNQNVTAGNGGFAFQTLSFSDANNVSFSTSAGGAIVASASFAAGAGSLAVGAVGSTNTVTQLIFSNSNNVTFGLNASTITASVTVASTQASLAVAALASTNTVSQIMFSNANGVSFGLDASTITASVNAGGAAVTISSYEPFPFGSSVTLPAVGFAQSYMAAFLVPLNISASFIRMIANFTALQAITLTTAAASMNASVEHYTTWNYGIFSMGTGASSNSVVLVTSSSLGWTLRNSISCGADGTSCSYTQALTHNALGNQVVFSTSRALATSVYSFSSAAFSDFTGTRLLDLDWPISVSPGAYWLAWGLSASAATNSTRISRATSMDLSYLQGWGVQQANTRFIMLGSTQHLTGGYFGAAVVGSTTTFSIAALSSFSTNANQVRAYFQFLRSA